MNNSQAKAEGVIKFNLNWEEVSLDESDEQLVVLMEDLNQWRDKLVECGMLGQDPERYEGLGFGNISQRTARGFLITGSQTGHLRYLQAEHFSEVIGWQLQEGDIQARGLAKPSSESLTHAAVYQADQTVSCVFHVHCPDIWQLSDRLDIASTSAEIEYGSQKMADAVKDIVVANPGHGIVVMKGHEDGIVAYGRAPSQTGKLLMDKLNQVILSQ